ncbi:MAG: DUF3990 domain-containing protein [Bacteroidales bacterium]
MKVYHGSYIEITEIDLSQCEIGKDFGQGFYVTKIIEQANSWAERKGSDNGTLGFVTESYKKNVARNIQLVKTRI